MADNEKFAVNNENSSLKKGQAVETEPTSAMSPKWSHLTPFLQLVAAILSEFFYDDLVGFTLEFVYKRVVAVGHSVWNGGKWQESCIEFYDESFELVKTVGSVGMGEGQFRGVTGLCFDKSRRILFASDQWNHRIHKIDESPRFLCCFGAEVLKFPFQLSLSPDCSTLAVVDSGNHQALMFSAETGELLRRSEAVLHWPQGVCHLSNDELLVAHTEKVLMIEGVHLKSELQSDEFKWEWAWDIVMDASKGVVFISDAGANRVVQFSKSGEYLGSIASHGGEPLKSPSAIAVDAAGILFVKCKDGIRVFDEANSKFGDGHVDAIAIIEM